MKKGRGIPRSWLWISVASVLLAGILALVVPARDWTDLLENSIEGTSLVRGLLIFGAAYVLGTLLLIPAWIFPVAAGAAFGWGWGLAASVVSSTLGALCAFFIGRYALRSRMETVAKKDEAFAAVDKAVRGDPWKVVALLRLSPVLPSGLKSYFLGVTCVGPVAYALGSVLGMLPGLAIKVWVGHAGRSAISSGGPLKWGLLALGLGATLAMALVVGRAARRRLGF